MKTIRFKSTPENFVKEWSGRKPNTIRKIDITDERFKLLRKGVVRFIEIEDTETKRAFKREITDYTEWEDWGIISWRIVNLTSRSE